MLVGLDEKMLVGLDEKKIDGLDEKELEAKKAWSRLGTRAKQVPVSQKTDNPQQKNEERKYPFMKGALRRMSTDRARPERAS